MKYCILSTMLAFFQVPPAEWQAAITGISRRDILLLAAKTLASSYK